MDSHGFLQLDRSIAYYPLEEIAGDDGHPEPLPLARAQTLEVAALDAAAESIAERERDHEDHQFVKDPERAHASFTAVP